MADNKKAANISAKKARNSILLRRIGISLGAIILVAVVLVSYFTSTTYYRQKTVLEVGNQKVSVAEFNYYYWNTYQNMYSSLSEYYGDYISMILDSSKPLDEQQYSDTQTWEDYLTELTISSIEELYAFCEAASRNGYTLSEEEQQALDGAVASITQSAKDVNYSLDNYLQTIYGKGVNEKLYRSLIERVTLGGSYSEHIKEGFSFTDAEMADFYDNHKADIDSVSARLYALTYETPEEDAEDADAEDADTEDTDAEDTDAEDADTEEEATGRTYDEALAIAKDFAATVTDQESFTEYIYNIVDEDDKPTYSEDSATRFKGLSSADISDAALADWLFDQARTENEIGYLEVEGQIYLLMFLSRTDNDYNLVSMRHLLLAPDEEAETEKSIEELDEEIQTQINEIYDEWVADGADETDFANLANTYSVDGDGTTGGLYEGIYDGQMVDPINQWLFAEGNQPGDHAIIETEYGWHIVYFSSIDDNFKEIRLDDAMRADAYSSWYDEVVEDYTATVKESGLKLTR